MTYSIKLVDRAEREASIRQSVAASTETEDFFEFRDQRIQLSVIRVPLDLLIYRMENFRTFSDQRDFLAKQHKTPDFFSAGQENESVQQIQHAILVKLAEKGRADSVVPIIDVLRSEGQRETLLITTGGVVTNGNRRLAAMRELFASGEPQFQQFSHVSCKVLPPDATANDILDIEGRLQAKPETRLEYDWIGDAQLLNAMVRTKKTPEAVARFLGRKPKEVTNSLQALMEADLYLKEWVHAEGQYGLVTDEGKQLFKDLPSELQGKGEPLKQASRAIAWSLFENPSKRNGRLYNYNVAFGKRATDVLQRLAEELGVTLTDADAIAVEDVDFDIGEDDADTDYSELITVLRDPARKGVVIEELVDICDSVVESEREERNANAPLKAVRTANAKLAEVDLSRAGKDSFTSIKNQLESVITRANALKIKLETIMTGQVKSDTNEASQL